MVKKPLEEHISKLTSEEKKILFSLRDRIHQLNQTYGSVARSGRSPFESLEEIAVVWKLARMKVNYGELGKLLGVSKVSVFRWIQKIKDGKIAIYNREKGVTETIEFTIDQLENILKELSKARAKKHLSVITDSKVIQDFVKNPVRIQRSKKKYYNQRQVLETLKVFETIASYIKEHEEELRNRYEIDIPSNPDLWASNPNQFEEIIADIITTICLERYPSNQIKYNQCKAVFMGRMKRLRPFREWFKGMIGRVTNRISPKEATLYLKDIWKFRKIVEESGDRDLEAFYWIAILHITVGSREGYGSIKNKVLDLKAQGIQLPKQYENPMSLDLDDEFIDSSLIGIKWKNILVDTRTRRVIEIKVFERKTGKWAIAKYLDLVDERLPSKLYEFWEYARKKGIQSVIKTILRYYGIAKDKVSVYWFKEWYRKHCNKLQELLDLPYKITPHRLRSAHVSILAELRIPLELVLDHNVGFGVGWEDLTTAKIFYLRFSRTLIEDYLRKAYEIKKSILA